MIGLSYVEELTHYRTFRVEKHKLANALHVSDQDAEQELLTELVEHRMARFDDDQVKKLITLDDAGFSFKIVYARKDILRAHYRTLRRQQETQESLIDLQSDSRTQEDILQALDLVPALFSNTATQEFVTCVLMHGKEETMKRMSLTKRQFSLKLWRTEQYCIAHRQKIIGLIKTKADEQLIKEHNRLQSLHDVLTDEASTDADIQAWCQNNQDYCDDVAGRVPGIHEQVEVIEAFATAPRDDQYRFIEWCESRLDELTEKLVNA